MRMIADRLATTGLVLLAALAVTPAGGADLDLVAAMECGVVGDHQPDLTLVFDLPFEVGLERALGRGAGETRFETKGAAFHARLREGFRAVAEANPDRCRLIDAAGDRVMHGVHPLEDLAPRDVVSLAITRRLATRSAGVTDHVYLDTTGIAPDVFRRRFPTVSAACNIA